MDHSIDTCKTSLTFAVLLGGFHLVWSVLVALGWAQAILDFVFWAHMITPPFTIEAFNMTAALTLIILTSVIGAVFGYLLAVVWNRMHRS